MPFTLHASATVRAARMSSHSFSCSSGVSTGGRPIFGSDFGLVLLFRFAIGTASRVRVARGWGAGHGAGVAPGRLNSTPADANLAEPVFPPRSTKRSRPRR